MKILNLYCGVGGNRRLWEGHSVVGVELDDDIAMVYQKLFPQDIVERCDAHEYLLKHHTEFDFIWSSPPCPSHGQYRYNVGYKAKGYEPLFPDMKLYEEIIFLKHYFKGGWVVENTKPFYEPLVKPTAILQRHLFWSNFDILEFKLKASEIRSKNKISDFFGADAVIGTKIKNKRQVLRNCVDAELGKHVLRHYEKKFGCF